MSSISRLGRSAFATVIGGTIVAATLAGGGAAQAQTAQLRGFSPVETCTGVTGTVSYHPGLIKGGFRNSQAVLTGTLTGCRGSDGAQDGTGTVTAFLSGRSKVGSILESGTMTVNWPAASGLAPSNGTVTVSRTAVGQPVSVSGAFTSGAYTGAHVSSALVITGHHGAGTRAHPLKRQSFVNSAPFTASRNFG